MSEGSGRVEIQSETDVLQTRQQARDAAEQVGFDTTDITRIVTAVSELARNIHLYAGEGTMEWKHITDDDRTGLTVIFEDQGPGIDDPDAALEGEFSTSDGLGRGLSGTQTLMDDMEIDTEQGEGTTITITKWHS
ncbi:anti-sigma regulatory factor [Halorubrum sp. BV1]|uniref:anti-sigma regulatory factor n=1 Tax=Halorubrum sp. BV1 TaxID=1498500 RepID=UPI000678A32F|nr:anti-sigma regulatory factor [Halorubrum sp. BV1]